MYQYSLFTQHPIFHCPLLSIHSYLFPSLCPLQQAENQEFLINSTSVMITHRLVMTHRCLYLQQYTHTARNQAPVADQSSKNPSLVVALHQIKGLPGQSSTGQVRSECLTCTFRASCCSARLSWAQVLAFASSSVWERRNKKGGGSKGGGGGACTGRYTGV